MKKDKKKEPKKKVLFHLNAEVVKKAKLKAVKEDKYLSHVVENLLYEYAE
jgi:hypothetical protein